MLWLFFLIIFVFSVSVMFTRQFCNPQSKMHLLDYPNDRSLHLHPTPRSGGVAIIAPLIMALPIWAFSIGNLPYVFIWIGIPALIISVLAFLDDRFKLKISIRFAGQVISVFLAVFGSGLLCNFSFPGAEIELSYWFSLTISIIYLLWMTNLYNFMDGMDGFAGGMAVFGFTAMAILAWNTDATGFIIINLVITASVSGFLIFNFPPAKIFMGDAGSATLGFIAGGMSLWAEHSSIVPIWISITVFSPFIVDATVTLLRRMLKKERIWQAHKTHYYQRLVQLGWGHRKTVLVEYGLMLICLIVALLAINASTEKQFFFVIFLIVLYTAFFKNVTRLELKYRQTV